MQKILASTLNHIPTFATDTDEADLNSFHEEAANDFPSFSNYVHAESDISHGTVRMDDDSTAIHVADISELSPDIEVEDEEGIIPELAHSQRRGRPKSIRVDRSKLRKIQTRRGRGSYRQDIGILADHPLPVPTPTFIEPINPKPYVLQNVERLQRLVQDRGDRVTPSDWMALEAAKREAEKAIGVGSDP